MGGLTPEYPAMTDAEKIIQMLENLQHDFGQMQMRLDSQAQGINAIGGNLQWLVENVQGLFQMFASPQFMSQMSNMLVGGLGNAGRQDSGPEAGPVEGTQPGGTGN